MVNTISNDDSLSQFIKNFPLQKGSTTSSLPTPTPKKSKVTLQPLSMLAQNGAATLKPRMVSADSEPSVEAAPSYMEPPPPAYRVSPSPSIRVPSSPSIKALSATLQVPFLQISPSQGSPHALPRSSSSVSRTPSPSQLPSLEDVSRTPSPLQLPSLEEQEKLSAGVPLRRREITRVLRPSSSSSGSFQQPKPKKMGSSRSLTPTPFRPEAIPLTIVEDGLPLQAPTPTPRSRSKSPQLFSKIFPKSPAHSRNGCSNTILLKKSLSDVIQYCWPFFSLEEVSHVPSVSKGVVRALHPIRAWFFKGFFKTYQLGPYEIFKKYVLETRVNPNRYTKAFREALEQLELSSLTNIDLSGISLQKGALDVIVHSWPRLRVLSLNDTQVADDDFRALGDLAELETLCLADKAKTNKTVSLQWMQRLEKLQTLILSGRQNLFFSLNPVPKSVTQLDVSDSSICDHEFQFLLGCSLQVINMDRCQNVTNMAFEILSKSKTITFICCRGCTNITEKGVVHLKQLKLKGFDCGSIATDSWIENLNGLADLENLFLVDSKITDEGISKLKLKKLKGIDLTGCRAVTEKAIARLTRFKLNTFALSYVVTDPMMASIQKLRSLEQLFLRYAQNLTDEGLFKLKLPKLRELDLQGCSKITERGVAHVRRENPKLRVNDKDCPNVKPATCGRPVKKLDQDEKLNQEFSNLSLT